MKTYLLLWFASDGGKPSEVVKKLEGLGFKPMHGNYDMVYDWPQKSTIDDSLSLGDRVQKRLNKNKVMFKLETE